MEDAIGIAKELKKRVVDETLSKYNDNNNRLSLI